MGGSGGNYNYTPPTPLEPRTYGNLDPQFLELLMMSQAGERAKRKGRLTRGQRLRTGDSMRVGHLTTRQRQDVPMSTPEALKVEPLADFKPSQTLAEFQNEYRKTWVAPRGAHNTKKSKKAQERDFQRASQNAYNYKLKIERAEFLSKQKADVPELKTLETLNPSLTARINQLSTPRTGYIHGPDPRGGERRKLKDQRQREYDAYIADYTKKTQQKIISEATNVAGRNLGNL